VTTIAFTPNGSQLITLSWDNTARLWDIATGNHTVGILESSDSRMSSTAISPDVTRFITGYGDGNLLLWSVSDDLFGANGRVKAHCADIYCLSISLDLKRVASASVDGTIRFWDASTGQSQGDAVVAHENRIKCIEFSSDGKYLASGSNDCTARVWDAATGLLHTQPLEHHLKPVGALAFSRNTEYLATGSEDHTIGLWNVDSGQLVGKMTGHSHFIRALAFSDEVGRIVSGTPNGELKQWSFPSCEEHTDLAVKYDKMIESMVISPDGKVLALVVDDYLEIWKLVPEWKKVTRGICNNWRRATDLYFDPSGQYVWMANNIWEVPAE
jgi:WD40 repeat protein